jgi:streptogramin lyase
MQRWTAGLVATTLVTTGGIGFCDVTSADAAVPNQRITEFPTPTRDSGPHHITPGPDRTLWFTESNADQIGRLTLGASSEAPKT